MGGPSLPVVRELDVSLRAYAPAFEQIGGLLPEPTVTLTNIGRLREATGLTWEPAAEPQYRQRTLGPGMEAFEKVEGLKYVTRGEGGPILGSLGQGYHLFPNAELFGIAETIGVAAAEQGRAVRFIAGGEIDGGRRVYLLADLGVVELPGDPSPHVRYMTLLSSHNGRGAVKVLGTSMRWMCTNALHAVEMEAASAGSAFSFRHTARLSRRLEHSRKAITAAMTQHSDAEAATAALLARRVRPEQASEYLRQFALAQVVAKGNPLRQEQASASPQREHAVHRLEGELARIFASATCTGIRDTAYGPLAAVVEYLDNVRPAESPDSRFARTMVNTERGKVLGVKLARRL